MPAGIYSPYGRRKAPQGIVGHRLARRTKDRRPIRFRGKVAEARDREAAAKRHRAALSTSGSQDTSGGSDRG
jgi:hypothetical protein